MSASTVLHDAAVDSALLQRCKKCTLPIVEGHAYELGDDRWHINCFKCSKCSSSLGCNSNFLILGNGNLICSNCSYNCKQCGKKIDDLAILTGDQAYCSNCFKCRSCKQKIEDLRYARTSKGLFCMNCHEKLMAKKHKYDLKKRQLKTKPPRDLSRLSSHERVLQENNLTQHRSHSHEKVISQDRLAAHTPPHDSLGSLESLVSERDRFGVLSSHDRISSSQSLFKDAVAGSSDFTFNIKPVLEQVLGIKHEDEIPLRQPLPQTASTSRSDFYDLYNRSSSSTPKLEDESAERPTLSFSVSTDKLLPKPPIQDNDLNTTSSTPDSQSTAKGTTSLLSKEDKENIIPSARNNLSREFSIEEINDSDDELNTRNKISHRAKTPPLSAIPILSPETPRANNELQPAAQLQPTARASSPASMSQTTFQGKNVLILSPNQEENGPLRSPDSIDRNNLFIEREAKSKSACSSPMAKANRHARVLEADNINDDLSDEESSLQQDKHEDSKSREFNGRREDDLETIHTVVTPERNSEFSTPRKQAAPHHLVSSPPPRFPLPSVPTPKQNSFSPLSPHRDSDTEDTHGLGLEGIEYYDYEELTRRARSQAKTQRVINEATPAVTNLEEDGGGSPQMSRDLGLTRKQSLMRTPILTMRHKRSTSGGSNGGIGRLNIFKTKEDRSVQGHSRNVSEGSIKSNSSAFVTPPLPFNKHNRSSSDTQSSSKTFEYINLATDHDLRSMKLEVYQLEAKKTVLNNDIKKMNVERQKLIDELELLRAKVREETSKHNELLKANKQLKLAAEAEIDNTIGSLSVKDDVVPQVIHHSSSSLGINNNNTISTSTNSASTEGDDTVETHKATRLKFWKRAKLGFNQQPNLVSAPIMASKEEDDPKRPFGLMTRSKSTNLLESFLNGNGVDEEAPLFNSSIQKRSEHENLTIPMIITRCIKEVEAKGLDMEGIYRISGGNLTIISIEQAFASIDPRTKDEKQMARLDEALDCDINAVTSALKRYLRKIPDPLIPYASYTDFIKLNSITNEDRRAHEFKTKIVDNLPPSNREVLRVLCKHLEMVHSYSNVNRMTYRNLSVVFAPTIARDETGEREMVDMGHRNDVTEFLFSNYTKIM